MNFNNNLNHGSSLPYDNVGAHAEVMKMMNRGEKLSVSFGVTKDQHPCAWIESKNIARFKYLLDKERLVNLINYLVKSVVIEYSGNPMQSYILKKGEDYQFEIMKLFIENGQTLQYVPQFRNYPDRISANKAMFKGTMFFRIPRTKENLDYLHEMKQPI